MTQINPTGLTKKMMGKEGENKNQMK